ncbi:MAG TPA: hypothetical protein VNF50_01530 [Acidimicrobiales bacterium]|nr:hypothetical protein [Acidimicrobiales bacterium]
MTIDIGAGVAFLIFASSTGVMAAAAGHMQRQSTRRTGIAVPVGGNQPVRSDKRL